MVDRSDGLTGGGDDGHRLVAMAQADPEQFTALYRRHYRQVAQYILRRVGDVHTAEDLAAETFIDAWRGLRRYRPTGVPFEHWLLRIATNRVHRWGRRNRKGIEHHGGAGVASAPSRAGAVDVFGALGMLSQTHQDVLYLHHVEELSIEAVAVVLGCGEGTIKSRLHRAREALRRELERLEVDP